LPQLIPPGLRMADLTSIGGRAIRIMSHVHLPVMAAALLALLCALVLLHSRDRLWNRDIAALSPVSQGAQRLDAQLRNDLGAPDLGSLVVIRAPDEQSALALSEAAGKRLDALIGTELVGYDSPAHYLPSEAVQRSRRDSLPSPTVLRTRVAAVSTALSLQPDALTPFIEQIETARGAPTLTRAGLKGTSLALGMDALLWQADTGWCAVLPLRGAPDLTPVRRSLSDLAPQKILVLNVKQETDALYGGYLTEAMRLSMIGFAAIVLLLLAVLRDAGRVARVIGPLLLAVLVVAASLAAAGIQMTILHLIGMLLIVAVGSNYALFFDRRSTDKSPEALPLTLASLIVANSCTVIGFGVLAFSSVPVLNALGMTVAPGTLLALWFCALLAPRDLWT
jgi:predicted exporter